MLPTSVPAGSRTRFPLRNGVFGIPELAARIAQKLDSPYSKQARRRRREKWFLIIPSLCICVGCGRDGPCLVGPPGARARLRSPGDIRCCNCTAFVCGAQGCSSNRRHSYHRQGRERLESTGGGGRPLENQGVLTEYYFLPDPPNERPGAWGTTPGPVPWRRSFFWWIPLRRRKGGFCSGGDRDILLRRR
eukprot:gene5004-biopygen10118